MSIFSSRNARGGEGSFTNKTDTQGKAMKKQKSKIKAPPQITLGGDVGRMVWKRYIVPLLKKDLSTREIAGMLGVSHMTVARWRAIYS